MCFKPTCHLCKNQVRIHKHPWGAHEFSKGSISEFIAFGCNAPEDIVDGTQRVIMMDHEVSSCEMFEFRFDD